eukprot:m.163240 g.163240  ORF g.163240 m.163240 type:complete len:327 (+) comp14626_c0_seq9:85-1065(+)
MLVLGEKVETREPSPPKLRCGQEFCEPHTPSRTHCTMPQDRPPAYDGTISLNNAYSADSSTEGAPAMSKIADHLRRELGLTGTVREVIDAAAEQLGVPKNLALKEKAERCYAEVSFDGFSADDVEVIDTRTATRASERRQQQQNEAPVSEAESQARATLALLRLAALAQALEELEGETVSAQDITGCWLSLCCIPLCCSCSQKMGVERDGILTRGCCCFAFLPLCGIDTKRGRESGSNVFSLLGNPSDQEDFSSDSCACSGVWCSCKCLVPDGRAAVRPVSRRFVNSRFESEMPFRPFLHALSLQFFLIPHARSPERMTLKILFNQ